MRWLDNLKEVTGKDLKELKEMVQDRSRWRRSCKKSPGVENDSTQHDDDDEYYIAFQCSDF